jgi:acyl carrier protein
MMTDQEVLAQLQEIFEDVFLEPVEVAPELTADDVDEWDSMLHISLVVAVEKSFKVRFSTGEVELTQNIGELMQLIKKHLAD